MSEHKYRNGFSECHLTPSQRTQPKIIQVKGCLDVWEVRKYSQGEKFRSLVIGTYLDKDEAYFVADRIWAANKHSKKYTYPIVFVTHRCALLVNDKYHFVNIPSFKFSPQTDGYAPAVAPLPNIT